MDKNEIHTAVANMGSGDQQVACNGYVRYKGSSDTSYTWYWVPYIQCAPGNAFADEYMVRYVSCTSPTTSTTYPNYMYMDITDDSHSVSDRVTQIF